MSLYLICYSDDNGDNADWFVCCESPDKAVELWNARTADEDDGEVRTDTPDHLFEISPLAHLDYGVLGWGGDKIVRHI